MNDHLDPSGPVVEAAEPHQRFAGLYDFSPTGYLLLDQDGIVCQANVSAAAMIATSRSNLIGSDLGELLDDRDRRHLLAAIADPGPSGTVLEVDMACADAEVRTIRLHLGAGDLGSGERERRCAMIDVTHDRKAAAAVDELMQEYQVLLDNAFNGIALVRNGRIIRCNTMLERMLGYAPGTIAGKPVSIFGDQATPESVEPEDALSPPGGRRRYQHERQLACADGGRIWCLVSGVEVDPTNPERGTIWRVQDISARKADEEAMISAQERLAEMVEQRTRELSDTVARLRDEIERRSLVEHKLRDSEQRYREVVEHASDVFYETDRAGRFTFFNPATTRILGHAESELMGRSFRDLVHPSWRDEVVSFYRQQFDTRTPSTYLELPALGKDGETVWLGQNVQLVMAEGRIVGTRAYCRDVSDRRRREEELAMSRERLRKLSSHLESVREAERSRIAREIHDELGSALTSIKLGLSFIGKTPMVQSEQFPRRKFAGVIQSVDAAIQTVRKIATDLRPSILDNLGLWAAIEWQGQEMERRLGIPFEIKLGALEPDAMLDRDRASAVFRFVQEALTNVARHAEASHVSIAANADAHGVHVQISDNGKGMDDRPANDAKSFGLLGMEERAQSFGGSVSVESTPGHGTTIAVNIPYGVPD